MRRLIWMLAAVTSLIGAGGSVAMAQGYDYGDPGYHRPPPPPPDDDGFRFRRPPPPDEDGFRRPPPHRYGFDDRDRPLVCRTEEGSCGARGPQIFRRRCLCDFGDGPVPGRLKP